MLKDIRLEPQTEYTHCDNCDCTIDDESCFIIDDITLCEVCATDIDYYINHINQRSKIDGYDVVELLKLLRGQIDS